MILLKTIVKIIVFWYYNYIKVSFKELDKNKIIKRSICFEI